MTKSGKFFDGVAVNLMLKFSMSLSIGTKAPDFTLPTKTADGPKQIKLSDNFGKKNTLLLFFPMAFTGTCTTEMCGVSNDLAAYSSLNAAVYGISGDNPFARTVLARNERAHLIEACSESPPPMTTSP